MKRIILSLFAFCVLISSSAHAESKTYTFDKLHTQILFFVGHMGFSHSNGKFLDFDGGFTFDEANPNLGTTNVTIKTDSLNMDDATWDEHLKAKDMFNVAQFPTMTFKSTGVEMTGEKTAKLNGDLTLLGVTKPVTLDVTFNKCGEHMMSKAPTCGFDATGHIKRSDWGMSYGIPMVDDEVELRITVEGSAQTEMNK